MASSPSSSSQQRCAECLDVIQRAMEPFSQFALSTSDRVESLRESGDVLERILQESLNAFQSIIGLQDRESIQVRRAFLKFLGDHAFPVVVSAFTCDNVLSIDAARRSAFVELQSSSIDAVIEVLVALCNEHPAAHSIQALGLLYRILSSDFRFLNRFRPTKSTIFRLNLALWIQNQDMDASKTAMDMALLLLSSFEHLDMDDISTNGDVIAKITWAARRQSFHDMKQHEKSIRLLLERSAESEKKEVTLSSRIDDLENQIADLRAENAGLRSRLDESERSLSETIGALQVTNTEVDGHGRKLQEHSSILESHENALRDQFSALRLHSDEISQLSSSADAHGEELQNLNLKSDDHASRIDSVTNDVDILITGFVAHKDKLNCTRDDAHIASEMLDALYSQIESNKSTAESIFKQVEDNYKDLTERCNSIDEEAVILRNAVERIRDYSSSTFADVRDSLSQVENSLRDIRKHAEFQSSASAKIAEHARSVEDMKSIVSSVAQGFNAIKSEIDKLWGSVRRLAESGGHSDFGGILQNSSPHRVDASTLRKLDDEELALLTERVSPINFNFDALSSQIHSAVQSASSGEKSTRDEILTTSNDAFSNLRLTKRNSALDDIPSDVEEDEDDTMHVDGKKKSSSSVRSSANSSFVLGRASSHASYRSMPEHDPSHVDKSDTMQIFVSEDMLLEADRQLKHLSHSTLATQFKLECLAWVADNVEWMDPDAIVVSVNKFAEFLQQQLQIHTSSYRGGSSSPDRRGNTHELSPSSSSLLLSPSSQKSLRAMTPQPDAVSGLVIKLGTLDPPHQLAALVILEAMLLNDQNISTCLLHGGVEVLLQVIESSNPEIGLHALHCLRSCTRSSATLVRLSEIDGFVGIANLLNSEHVEIVVATLSVLRSCARLDEVIPVLENIGCVEKFMDMLSSTDERILEHAVAALRNCARLDRIITKIQESGGLEKIFHVMKSSLSSEVGKCAAGALLACSRNVKAQYRLQAMGALEEIHVKYPVLK